MGGLTQLQSLIAELGFYNMYYVRMIRDAGSSRVRPIGVIRHQSWTRKERFQIENGAVSDYIVPLSQNTSMSHES